ncbi:uncharacterized protein SAPINGB_P005832 [Magnusiomyces paraingens]|uniref:Uncharacterized protein n=1 Tax=Magnusiomyces paraingens TaxID=2606893 RepID=A0A5E8C2X9_9ASCO|nr:uncharacterized protein SAPINGB_P005832 [Saprochaete ingens]VVT57712.1 unnamed protein product [Saprochaete ingens]
MAAQPIIKYPYLISKTLDPIFGFAVGIMAFGTYEKRVGREDGHTLKDLVMAKFIGTKAEPAVVETSSATPETAAKSN